MPIPAKRIALSVACAIPLVLTASASAVNTTLMRISGVRGEVATPAKYQYSIDLKDFSWGIKNSTTGAGGGTGGGDGKASFDDFQFTKDLDSTSTFWFKYAATGAHINSIRVLVVNSGDTAYAQFCLEGAVVTKYAVSADEETPRETIALSPQKVELRYLPQSPGGTAASPLYSGWDLVSATTIGFNNNCGGIGN